MSDQSPRESGLIRAAELVASLAARHATAAEQAHQLDPAVAASLVEAGFARHFVPTAYGGTGGGFTELLEAVAVVGASCPATAWCASIVASLARMAAVLPPEGRKEIWGEGPDAVIVGSVSPMGKAHATPDGWRLSGSWPYVSAVDHSDWALLLALVPSEGRPEPRAFAVPRAAYRVEATWSDIGMRATGSNTVVVEDVAVPRSLSAPAADLLAGRAPSPADACHALPLPAVNGLFFCLPILGAAQGALREWSGYAVAKITGPPPHVGPGKSFYEEVLARSSGEIDAARLLLEEVARTADRASAPTALETARNQRDCALAADLLVGAVDRLFRASGTSGHSTEGPLQRLWRDVHSAAGHVVLQFGPAATAYARQVAGPVPLS